MKKMMILNNNILEMISGGQASPPPPNKILNTASGKLMPDNAFDNGQGLFDNASDGIGPFVLVYVRPPPITA